MGKPRIEYVDRLDDFILHLPNDELFSTRMTVDEMLVLSIDIDQALEERFNAHVLRDVEDSLRG